MFANIDQVTLLHLYIHARLYLRGTFRATVEMQNTRLRGENTSPARLADTAAPISLFSVNKELLIK